MRQRETCLSGCRALDEQTYGFILRQSVRENLPHLRQRKRWNTIHDLAADTQRLAAARQNFDIGTRPQNGLGQLGTRAQQMLTVIENQQQHFGLQEINEGIENW